MCTDCGSYYVPTDATVVLEEKKKKHQGTDGVILHIHRLIFIYDHFWCVMSSDQRGL